MNRCAAIARDGRPRPGRTGGRRAMAIVIVLGILALLLPLAISFFDMTSQRYHFARHAQDDAAALELARSGLNLARLFLALDARTYTYYYLDETPGLGSDGKLAVGRSKDDSKIDQAFRYFAMTQADGFPLDDGVVSIRFEDDGGKININRASIADLQRLFNVVGIKRKKKLEIMEETVSEDISQEAALSVVNWRSPDGMQVGGGATDAFYEKESPAYVSRKAPFETVDELLLIKDMPPEAVIGNPQSVTTGTTSALEPSLPPTGTVTAAGGTSLEDLCTIAGNGKININTAPPDVLKCLPGFFESNAKENLVSKVIEKRPFRDLGEAQVTVAAVDPAAFTKAAPMLAVKSDVVTVLIAARIGTRVRRIRALLSRQGNQLTTLDYRED